MNQINFIGVEPNAFITEICGVIENNLFNRFNKIISDQRPKEYLSAEEVCKRLCITKPTIHDWKKRGILKSYKLGSRQYYRFDEIEEAMIING